MSSWCLVAVLGGATPALGSRQHSWLVPEAQGSLSRQLLSAEALHHADTLKRQSKQQEARRGRGEVNGRDHTGRETHFPGKARGGAEDVGSGTRARCPWAARPVTAPTAGL